MQSTSTPTAERAVTIIRRPARRPIATLRHPVAHGHGRPARPIAEQRLRERVLDGFRRMAHSVDAPTADRQSRAFYRSSGHEWSRSLTEQSGREVRARVVAAFRETARGVQDASAHASTLRFYRSSGHAWAHNLG